MIKKLQKTLFSAALAVTFLSALSSTTGLAQAAPQTIKAAAQHLTLAHLKNGSYEIADSACGSRVITLKDGKHEAENGFKVVFGRATFGALTDKHEPGAVVHLAYHDPMFGWMQQVVFVVERGDQILQIAELGLDEREQIQNIEIREGNALIETSMPDEAAGKVFKKCTQAKLVESKEGCELTASELAWYNSEGSQGDRPSRIAAMKRP